MAPPFDLEVPRKRRRRDISTLEIPLDVVIEILTRLPAKSLMRFKSVSKLWSSLICSRYFTKRFQKVASSSPRPRLYMWLGFEGKNVLLSSLGDTSSFLVDQDLTIPAMEGYEVSHVSHGLMCLNRKTNALIYNTTTRQLVVLPDVQGSKSIDDKYTEIIFHIVHDAIHDQYKVVCIILRCVDEDHESEHWVLLLDGPNRCWRKISSQCPPHRPLSQGLSQKVTINGRMYYRAFRMLVSFDITSEEIITIEESDEDEWFSHPYVGILEYGGRVASLHYLNLDEGVIVLRILEDAEKNKWSKKIFELRPSQMHMVENIELWVRGTTRDGEVIFVPQNKFYSPRRRSFSIEPQSTPFFYFYRYNLQNNLFTKVEIKDTSNLYYTNMWDVVGFDDIENLICF